MKKLITYVGITVYSFCLFGQDQLNKLKTPSSPAASMLDVQPTVILQPKSFKALETAVFTSMNDSNSSIIPNNFSLEFTPYWASNHGLSLEDYINPSSSLDQLGRNFSISVASTQSFALGNGGNSEAIAFGVRSKVFYPTKKDLKIGAEAIQAIDKKNELATSIQGSFNYTFANALFTTPKEYLVYLKNVTDTNLRVIGNLKNENLIDSISNAIISRLPLLDMDKPDPFLDSLDVVIISEIEKVIKGSILENFKTYLGNRQGFSMDFAASTLLNFPTNNFEFSYAPRMSLWFTPSYNFGGSLEFLQFLTVLRYDLYDLNYYQKYFPTSTTFKNNLNYGFAINTQFRNIAFNIEVVGRSSNTEIPAGLDSEGNELYRRESESDIQYVGSVSYNLRKDLVLSYSLGKKFDPILNPSNTLVSLIALNLGFGGPGDKSK